MGAGCHLGHGQGTQAGLVDTHSHYKWFHDCQLVCPHGRVTGPPVIPSNTPLMVFSRWHTKKPHKQKKKFFFKKNQQAANVKRYVTLGVCRIQSGDDLRCKRRFPKETVRGQVCTVTCHLRVQLAHLPCRLPADQSQHLMSQFPQLSLQIVFICIFLYIFPLFSALFSPSISISLTTYRWGVCIYTYLNFQIHFILPGSCVLIQQSEA